MLALMMLTVITDLDAQPSVKLDGVEVTEKVGKPALLVTVKVLVTLQPFTLSVTTVV